MSVFSNVSWYSTQQQRFLLGGVVGLFSQGENNSLTNCYVFGYFKFFVNQYLLYGSFAGLAESIVMLECAFNGDI